MKRIRPFCLILLLLPALCLTAEAQRSGYTYRPYTTAEGLCDNQVQAIRQDSRGFLWIGTAEGLARFDGVEFRNYYAGKDSNAYMSSNVINGILEYKPGHLLLSFVTRIWCFDLVGNRFYPAPEPFREKSLIAAEKLTDTSLVLAGKDTVYITDLSFRIRSRQALPFRDGLQAGSRLGVISPDSILLTNNREHYFFYPRSGRFRPFVPRVKLPDDKAGLTWHCFDPNTKTHFFSNFWFGLWEISLTGEPVRHLYRDVRGGGLSTNHIGAVLPVADSLLYVGTAAGLNIVNRRRAQTESLTGSQTAVTENAILTLHADPNGVIWVGTSNGLVRELPAFGKRLFDGDALSRPLKSDWSIITRGADGRLYAGSQYEGLWKLESGTATRIQPRSLHMVWVLHPQKKFLLTGGEGPSLYRYNPQKETAEAVPALKPYYGKADILTLYYLDRYGDEWYSLNQGGGLLRKPAGQSQLQQYHRKQQPAPFQMGYVALAAEEASGAVWFAVNKSNRLLQWDPRRQEFLEWPLFELGGLEGQHFGGIQALLGGNDSLLWISSESRGLIAYHTGKRKARLYSQQDGLPSAYIYGMARDHRGRIWLATPKGLVCFWPAEQRFSTFHQQQGIPEDYFTSGAFMFDSVSHTLLAGSRNKIVQIDPDRLLRDSNRLIPVYLDEVLINTRPVVPDSRLRVKHSSNNLQFRFTGVDLTNGADLEYAYRLIGADPGWVEAGNKKTAAYHQLPPGHYRFQVRTRHKGDNAWSAPYELLVLEIRKAWWQTWAFRLGLLALGILLTGVLIRQYLQRKLRMQRQVLEQELAVEQERIRLARELHDGLGSQLSGVKHSFSALRNKMELPGESAVAFDSTLDKLNDSINELRNVSHSMMSSEFLEEGLESALRNYCAALAGKGPFSIRVQSLIHEPLVLGTEKSFQLFRIVQELLQNILKHAAATQALVQLSHHANTLHVTVEDNGKGFDTRIPEAYRGMGWRNVENRIRRIGGKVDIRSSPGQGTTVDIEVPVSD